MIHKDYVYIGLCIVTLPVIQPALLRAHSPPCSSNLCQLQGPFSPQYFFLFPLPPFHLSFTLWLLTPSLSSVAAFPFLLTLYILALIVGSSDGLSKNEWAEKKKKKKRKDLSSTVCEKMVSLAAFNLVLRTDQ